MSLDVRAGSWAEAYPAVLRKVLGDPDAVSSPRDQPTNEILDLRVTLPGDDGGLFGNAAHPSGGTDLRYLAGEILWYMNGRRDLSFIRRFSTFWDRLAVDSGDGQILHSAYGHALFQPRERFDGSSMSEWEWAMRALMRDPDTRQATMVLHAPYHKYAGNADIVCTMHLHFMIRHGQLTLRTVMRSSDVWYGLPFDVPFFLLLLQQATRTLLPTHPALRTGVLIHTAHSTHAYARNQDTLQRMLREPFALVERPALDADLVDVTGLASQRVQFMAHATENGLASGHFHGSRFLSWLWEHARRPRKDPAGA